MIIIFSKLFNMVFSPGRIVFISSSYSIHYFLIILVYSKSNKQIDCGQFRVTDILNQEKGGNKYYEGS